MRNPLENEEAAFRFVLGTIAYFAPIVVASWIATWLGVVVFVVATAVVIVLLRRDRTVRTVTEPATRAAVEDTWRILVLANETLEGRHLQEVVTRLAEGVAEDVLVVCPAGHGRSAGGEVVDTSSHTAAQVRLRAAVDGLRAAGVDARGELGDGDPVLALEAALRDFAADEILISTHAEGESAWLEQGLVAAAGARFAGPVTHVVGDAPVSLS